MRISMLYNPQEMPEQQFIDSFVVRHAILEKLLQQIRATPPGESFQHVIVQSLRGQGKTTLLRKLSLCVRDDTALSSWLIPVLFREEEYGITQLCRLWERTAEYLENVEEFQTLTNEYEQAYASPHYEKDCFNILGEALRKHDKHLLLLVDNLGELLDKFGKGDQQRLREILITCPNIRIIGASAATLEQHYDHGKPFFQFFRIHTLDGLDADEARTLLLSLGNKTQQRRIKAILKQQPGKVEALRRLTSGVPRTLILLFEIFLDKDGSALQDLEQLLDRVTPLYKHRLDDLPPQQQQIVQEIALGWDAMSAKEIAQKTRLDSKLVSAQLQQLERNRVVRKIPTSTKNHLYQLEERFFNIWCLMRLGRAGDKRRAAWLVKFLELWCDERELARLAGDHIKAMRKGKIQPHAALLRTQALSYALRDVELQEQLLNSAATYLPPDQAEALPPSDNAVFDKATKAYYEGAFEKAMEYIHPLAEKGYPVAKNNLALLLAKQNRLEEAEQYYRQAAAQGDADAMFNLARLLERQNHLEGAEQGYRQAVAQGHADAMFNLALLLAGQNRLEEAVQFSKQAVAANPNEPDYRLLLGIFELKKHEFADAFGNFELVLKRPNDVHSINEALLNLTVMNLCATGQTAFALKLFEHEDYRHLNLKERLKPLYYALLQEAGEAYKDQALRMGPELQETVAEIRERIAELRGQAKSVDA